MYTYEHAKVVALMYAFICQHLIAAVYSDGTDWYVTSHNDIAPLTMYLPEWARQVHYCNVLNGKRVGEWCELGTVAA